VGSKGRVAVDEGAKEVLQKNRVSLLPAGVVSISGSFTAGDAVEISGPDGIVFAKGLVRYDFSDLEASVGKQTEDLPERFSPEVVHADDLVVLPA
jgi:glutamate 5-kinase